MKIDNYIKSTCTSAYVDVYADDCNFQIPIQNHVYWKMHFYDDDAFHEIYLNFEKLHFLHLNLFCSFRDGDVYQQYNTINK